MAEQKPPPAGEPGQTPPLQPGELDGVANEYGAGPDLDGNGIPDEVGINPDNQQPGYPGTATQQTDADIPPSPGPTLDPSLLDPNAPYKPVNLPETGEVDQSFEVTGPPNQIPPGLEDEVAALEKTLGPDEVISIDLPVDQMDNRLDPNAPYEPGLPKFARDDLGQPPPGDSSEPPPPAPDPEPVQALDPNLLNPLAPGPTLDTGLVGRIEGNPDLVNAVNQDSSVAEALEQDPTYLYQIEQHLGLAEQWWSNDDPSFTDPSFMDPGLTEEQPLPDQSTPDEGADDLTL